MTCNEFRKCNVSGVDGIMRLTRAERSAAGHHWATCFECREWTIDINFGMTPEQMVHVELTKHQDRQDPETFFLSPEDAEKFDLDKNSANSPNKTESK
jgi:hypothetical protein